MIDTHNILVVDDTPTELEMVLEILSSEGYTVSTATSGEQALKYLQTNHPALILLDVNMPEMDGLDTCRRIKANAETASIPIILIIAFSDAEKITQGFSLGAVDYLIKPIREAELLTRVRTHGQLNALAQTLAQQVSARTAELQALEARQRKLFETSPIGLALCRMDGSWVDVNGAYADMIGRTIAETLTLTNWDITPEAYAAEEKRQLASLQETGRYGPYTKEYIHKAGHRVPVQLSSILLEQDGEALIWSSVEDISDRKRAEAQIRQSMVQLAAAHNELGSFAYSISHDLRAPLRAINGFIQALLEDYGGLFDDEGQYFLDRIRVNANRMGDLIDDLLRLSRISRSQLSYTTVNLSSLAQAVLDDLKSTQPERQVDVRVAPDLSVDADKSLMQVVLMNLLQNAWKFTSHHPTAHIEFGAIVADAQEAAETIYFIKDDGAGFDMTYRDKLFAVFQRLHGLTEFPGTGIGLAFVQRAIHRHGGRVWAEAAVEQGATFFFTIPATLLPDAMNLP